MLTNKDFFKAIKPILEELKEKVDGDFVLFGSSTLYLLGILKFKGLREIHDLDVALDGILKKSSSAKIVYFENDLNKKLYKININGINIDVGTRWAGQERWFKRIFTNPVKINGFKFANLQVVLDYKRMNVAKYGREKDKNAVAEIEKHLKG